MNLDVMANFTGSEQQTMERRDRLNNATCPVRVIGGELDTVCPIQTSHEVADSLPDGLVQLERLDGASHVEDEGDWSVNLVRAFVCETDEQ